VVIKRLQRFEGETVDWLGQIKERRITRLGEQGRLVKINLSKTAVNIRDLERLGEPMRIFSTSIVGTRGCLMQVKVVGRMCQIWRGLVVDRNQGDGRGSEHLDGLELSEIT